MVYIVFICWIVIYLLDSVIPLLNNRGQVTFVDGSHNCIVVLIPTGGAVTQTMMPSIILCVSLFVFLHTVTVITSMLVVG